MPNGWKAGARFQPRAMYPVRRSILYCTRNFLTKKALKVAVAAGERVTLTAPGLGQPKENGTEWVEGPHYPKPHAWYAEVEVRNGLVVKVK